MKDKDGILTGTPQKKGRLIKKDMIVFAFFLVLSFIFWYLNSLGKEIEAGIRYQLKYTNLPKERVISRSSDLELFLKGPGYSILKIRFTGDRLPLIIDFSRVNYKRVQGDKGSNYYIVTSGLSKSLNLQVRSGCEITSIKPDTLFFTLSKAFVNQTGSSGTLSDSKRN